MTLLTVSLPKSSVFQITETIQSMAEAIDDDELATRNDTSHSISPIEIPLIASQSILAVSPNYILANEYTKKRNRLVIIDDNLNRFSIRSPITDTIIDAVWYPIQKKFFLLTPRKIFSYDPNEKSLEAISDIKSDEKKPFKSFTIDNKQSSLLIVYDEWESKFIDRWQQDTANSLWKLIERYPLNLTVNEFLGIIFAVNEDDCSKLAITIYDDLIQQWRMELRHTEMSICLKKIPLPGSDPMHDYRMIATTTTISDIKWIIYSQATNEILAIDSQWKKIHFNYRFPVYRMAQFKEKNLIIRTRDRIDIHLFI
jgi:hypothetical protein